MKAYSGRSYDENVRERFSILFPLLYFCCIVRRANSGNFVELGFVMQ